MDIAHFGLSQQPFRNVPDPSFYFPAPGHEFALTELVEGIKDQEPLCLLEGAAGLGKTMLGLRILSGLDEGFRIAFLSNAHFSDAADLLRAILFDLGDPSTAGKEGSLRLTFTQESLDQYQQGVRTLILLDEAHLLKPELLEEVRMWGNLEGPKGRAVQVLLLAQPSIRDLLRRDDLASFRQRLGVRQTLIALTPEESISYLNHQLEQAGGKPAKLLSSEAQELLVEKCAGVPRVLNQVASRAFRLTGQAKSKQVDAEAVLEAVRLVSGESGESGDEPKVLRMEPTKSESATQKKSPARGGRRRTTRKAASGE